LKKRIQIFIAFIYLLGVLWVPLHAHHCGNDLTELSLFTGEFGSDNCDCAATGNTDCCTDNVIKTDNKDQNVSPKILQAPQRLISCYFIVTSLFLTQIPVKKADTRLISLFIKSPPCLVRTNINLGVFKI